MRLLKTLAITTVTIFTALALAACGSGKPDAAPPAAEPPAAAQPEFDREHTTSVGEKDTVTPVHGDWILRRLPAEMPHLNPITGTDAYASVLESHLFDSLLEVEPETLDFVPHLADSWDISEDHLTYTFHLREDVTFTDGDAADFGTT